jgi:hypothetical protein
MMRVEQERSRTGGTGVFETVAGLLRGPKNDHDHGRKNQDGNEYHPGGGRRIGLRMQVRSVSFAKFPVIVLKKLT